MKINIEIDSQEIWLVSQLNTKKSLNNPANTKRLKDELLWRIIHKIQAEINKTLQDKLI